ncbi:BlaI/MecI/CopY family transcriptional regulator [Candidatus Poribacteria bacterium]|nr:BlaI/MecI/CopY family transcriptional regulator [Candidatus Poribacteria bacterium]
MTPPVQLSDLQIQIMQVLWKNMEATVIDVQAALAEERGLAMTTIATMLTRLEKRGVVAHRTEGRQFVYRPLFSEQEIRRSILSEITDRLFQGDATALVSHLIDAKELTPGDLERVKALIESHQAEGSADHDN